jgi:nucleoside phosphorylase
MGYIRKLKWISRRLVILWDVDTKRGWLLNGTTALLHLVRASLEHDSKDKFSSQFLFQAHDMEEAPQRAACGSNSAIDVLLSDLNRKLRIYPEKDGYIYFEDRVEHLHGLLAQMIDHQDHALRSYDPRSANLSRASLEGWDFRDLVSDMDPVHPRTITLGTLGMAWIELARSLNAITLVGRGFGEIIKPAKQSCPQLTTLPIGKYYLAVSATDLMDIMDAVGDATAVPPRLTDDLVWLNTLPVTPSGFCRGGGQCTDDHVDVVQVLLPPNANRALKKTYTCLPEDGAVVFGHNENVPWFWKETGHPVYGTPDKLQPVLPSSSSDSGYGLTRESESDSTRPTSPPASIQGGTAPSTTGLRVPLAATRVKLGRRTFSLDAYTVGIVCALPLELFAVRALFDVTHAGKDGIITPSDDSNHYALGEIGKHKVVAACLPDGEYGTNSAADVVTNMKRTFTSVKFALLVGIGGGFPSPANDIRLGDVVVSRPTGTSPGVIQYDMGKAREDGVFAQVGYLQPPPRFIMTALSNLRSDPLLSATPLQGPLDDIAACRREYRYPGKDLDRLFTSDYPHDPVLYTCNSCDMRCLQPRANRPDTKNKNHHPRIHYGTIASGNRVVRDAKFRDHWSKQSNILCFEMEAAGIMNTVPCLVIRGICDYSDSHKNKVFQHYAAAAAASYAKLLLSYVKSARDPDGVVRAEIVEKRKHFKGLRRAFKDSLHIFARS